MSELMTTAAPRSDFRWQLLSTASALTLLAFVSGIDSARAADADRPTVWIELGGQLERIDGGQEQFAPDFIARSPRASGWKQSPLAVQKLNRYAVGADAKLTFAPRGSDWRISAAVRYGRNTGKKSFAQQTLMPTLVPYGTKGNVPPRMELGIRANGANSESHTVLDFMAGKDVGLGMFGGSSVLSAGIRFAQFDARSNVLMKSRPKAKATPSAFGLANNYYAHNYLGSADREAKFRGIGPSISWAASRRLAGNGDTAEFALDWGLNAGLLFGRQKTRTSHHTSGIYSKFGFGGSKYTILSQYQHPHQRAHSRSIVVPNLGGFAGASLRFPNAKVSFGYRADYFFGAMDSGLDTRKSTDRSFHGPFATISIGLGG